MQRPKVVLVNFTLPTYYPLAIYCLMAYAEADPSLAARWDIECLSWPNRMVPQLSKSGMTVGEILRWGLWIWRRPQSIREKARQTKHLLKRYRYFYLFLVLTLNFFQQFRLVARIFREKPAVVGFSAYLWNLEITLRAARWIKRLRPKTVILIGGQEVTNSRVDFLKRYPFLDLLVDGEGEAVFAEILRSLDPKQPDPAALPPLPCLQNRAAGGPAPAGKIPLDLDRLPSPYLQGLVDPAQLFRSQRNGLGIMVEMSRGCRFKCRFCFESERGQAMRPFPAQRFREEFRSMWKMGIRKFHILDPNLIDNDLTRLKEFDRVIEETAGRADDLFVSAEMYPEFVDEANLPFLRHIRIAELGLQSTHPDALKAIRRYFEEEKFVRGVERLNRAGKHSNTYLILGLPADNFWSFLSSLRFAFEARSTNVFINTLFVLNGTSLRDIAAEYRIDYNERPPYNVRSTGALSPEQIQLLSVMGRSFCEEYNVNFRVNHQPFAAPTPASAAP